TRGVSGPDKTAHDEGREAEIRWIADELATCSDPVKAKVLRGDMNDLLGAVGVDAAAQRVRMAQLSPDVRSIVENHVRMEHEEKLQRFVHASSADEIGVEHMQA